MHRTKRVGRVALESTSANFQSAAKPSQLPAHQTIRPDVSTPGLDKPSGAAGGGVSISWERKPDDRLTVAGNRSLRLVRFYD
jgi:hypothetical protein